MRISSFLFLAALATFRIVPAEAAYLALNGGFDDTALAGAEGFGHWVALDGEAVLVGSRADSTAPAGDLSVDRAFMFSTRDGRLLRWFDRPTVTPRQLSTPGILVDSYEVLIGPDDTGAGSERLLHVGMGRGTLTWTAHRASPTAGASRRAVAMDDRRILIGASVEGAEDARPREVGLYSIATGELLRTFPAPGDGDDGFGQAVAISGDLVLIGAPGDDANGKDAGGAYLYSASRGTLLHRFEDPAVTGADRFGTSVAVSGTTIAIGAPGDQSGAPGNGQAYLFNAANREVTHVLHDPGRLSRAASHLFGQESGYRLPGRSLVRGGAGGIGGGGFGGGGGSPRHWSDDGLPTVILVPDATQPGDTMPETPIPAPLPGALALYLAALGLGALLLRRRST